MNMSQNKTLNNNHYKEKICKCIPFLLSFIIPACILMLILAVLHVFPGLEKTVLTNDLAAQYTDFFSYFKSFFTGENNILYCLSQTLGNNMWGLFAQSLQFYPFVLYFQPAANSYFYYDYTKNRSMWINKLYFFKQSFS